LVPDRKQGPVCLVARGFVAAEEFLDVVLELLGQVRELRPTPESRKSEVDEGVLVSREPRPVPALLPGDRLDDLEGSLRAAELVADFAVPCELAGPRQASARLDELHKRLE
jgi:hypothetical protein